MRFLSIAADPLKILTKRIRVRSLILFVLMIGYICFSLLLFFQWVAPSLDGRTDQHIAADSSTYMGFADSLREGRADPYMISAVFSFPSTLVCPVLLALALKSALAMVVASYTMFFLAVVLLKKSFSFSTEVFVGLLLLNATTTISLISVNKEIVDLLAISIFFFARRRHGNGVLLLALLLALFNRYEVCMVMVLYLFAESRLNPLRQRRVATLVVLIVLLSVTLPLLASGNLSTRFEEAKEGHMVAWLDSLEMHYMYGFAVIPKVAENLFGELLNVSKLGAYFDFSDIANTYIVLFNNLASAVVVAILVWKRSFTVRKDLVYFAMIGWIIMAVALVIQPRYFYFAYVLLCLQAAQREGRRAKEASLFAGRPTRDQEVSSREAAFG